jgi:GST-like protein
VSTYKLFACAGWGSAIVEAALTLSDLPFAIESVDMKGGPGARRELLRVNPLGEIPTLILPDGTIMTESAAIILHLADLAPNAGLVPLEPSARRTVFLRWLIFIVAAIYPTFTYGDDPSRWVKDETGQGELNASTDAARERHWAQFEAAIHPNPWILGGFSAVDIYVTVMAHWRPRREWFEAHTPKLDAIARAGLALPKLKNVWERNEFINK